ncbi:MAG: hypothetical protein U0263_41585 [Polyangiaceae bacterium]
MAAAVAPSRPGRCDGIVPQQGACISGTSCCAGSTRFDCDCSQQVHSANGASECCPAASSIKLGETCTASGQLGCCSSGIIYKCVAKKWVTGGVC